MKLATLLAAGTMLAACTPAAPPEPRPLPEGSCQADAANGLIGRERSEAIGQEAMRRTGARGLRWIAPGQAVTMDYRPDRLNIMTDAKGKIESFKCG